MLTKLAEVDKKDCIKKIFEYYGDYYIVNQELFTLNIPRTYGLS